MDTHYFFKDNLCKILESHNVEIAFVPMKNKNFSIYWQNVIANAAEVNFDESNLWHKRYGHYNFKSLAYLHSQGLVRDFPEINESGGVCESCNYGKMHREAFPTGGA